MDGAIVYYGIERYTGSTSNSSGQVQNFIGGWVDGLRQHNLLAGAYINQGNWSDLNQGASVVDNVYVAGYNGDSSVYGIQTMPNDQWSYDQRMSSAHVEWTGKQLKPSAMNDLLLKVRARVYQDLR